MPSDRETSEGDDPAAQHRHPQIAAASNEYRGRRCCGSAVSLGVTAAA